MPLFVTNPQALRSLTKWFMDNLEMIKLTFDFRLISKDNEKIYNRAGRFFLSSKFKAFEEKVAWEAKSQYKGEILMGNLTVVIIAYFKNKKHSDTGNLSKGILDALQGIIYKNDSQIKKLTTEVNEDNKRDWFTVLIKELLDA